MRWHFQYVAETVFYIGIIYISNPIEIIYNYQKD